MLRLAQRLAVLEPHNLGAWPAADDAARQDEVLNGRTTDNWEAWCAAAQRERQRVCDAIRQQARNCTSIMLDNVAEYVAENCRCTSKDNGEISQPVADTSKVLQMFHSGLAIRPPFDRCLLEWNAPRYWDKGENRMEAGKSMTAMQCGAWCSYTEQSAYLPISETQPHKYPDLVDVVFDHEPDRVSRGHFTDGAELLSAPDGAEIGTENIAP